METIKHVCNWTKVLVLFGLIFAAIWVVFYQPWLIQSQPYMLLHWAGIAIVILVLSQKISDYATIFSDPHQSLITILLQLVFVPIFMHVLTVYFHFPGTLALAFSLAAFSPGEYTHTILKTLFMAGSLFFLDWIGFYSPLLNRSVDIATDNKTKYAVLLIAFVPILYHEYLQHKEKQKPIRVYYIEDDDKAE